mmetsp:Transcript_47694/g.91112  ORF Transcript_47694/g.91112 Transcript_47694/m.91112 type:complete len:245 (-) Transcript_47694:1427-2161(-)
MHGSPVAGLGRAWRCTSRAARRTTAPAASSRTPPCRRSPGSDKGYQGQQPRPRPPPPRRLARGRRALPPTSDPPPQARSNASPRVPAARAARTRTPRRAPPPTTPGGWACTMARTAMARPPAQGDVTSTSLRRPTVTLGTRTRMQRRRRRRQARATAEAKMRRRTTTTGCPWFASRTRGAAIQCLPTAGRWRSGRGCTSGRRTWAHPSVCAASRRPPPTPRPAGEGRSTSHRTAPPAQARPAAP